MINKSLHLKNDISLSLLVNGIKKPVTANETEQIIEQEKSKNKPSLVNNKLHLSPQHLPLQTLQYTGSSEVSHCLTENQKAQIAREVYKDVKLKDGFYEDATVTSYLENLISAISTKMELTDSPNKVKVINSKEENAFVTTDKYLYITKGLLKALETEEEILAVFAHELGHAKHKHLEKRYEKDETFRKNGINQLVKFILKNEYSKECEFQADQFAVDSLIKMGRNPAGIRSLFGHFKKEEDETWNKLKEKLIKKQDTSISENRYEKSKKEREETENKIFEKIKFANRLIRTHPYASERLKRTCTLINHDLLNIKDNSLKPKECNLDEVNFIKNLTGTFDEKLIKFNERYPDGKEGMVDWDAQAALFEYATKEGDKIGNLKDERGSKLNVFAKEHATTLEEFEKIFTNHKIFNRDNIETFLLKMTQNKSDKIGDIAKLWACDFPNNFLAYGYPNFVFYVKESYGTRSIRNKSEITGDLSQKYYLAKVFGFRSFARRHLLASINTNEDLKRLLSLPFMSMAVTNIRRKKEYAYLTNEMHSLSLYNITKKIYKKETGEKDILTQDFWKFVGDVFSGIEVDREFCYKMFDDIKKYYVKTEKNCQQHEFQKSIKELVKSLSGVDVQKHLMSEISGVFDGLKIKDFAKTYCGIFDIRNEARDNILFSTLSRKLTLQSLKSYLPYFTFSRQNKINKIIGRNDKELTFNQRLEILEDFYPVKSVNNYIDSMYCEAAYIQAIEDARNPEEVIEVSDIYGRKMKQDKLGNSFFLPDPTQVEKFLHPSNLKKMYGDDFLKYIKTATELLNCISLQLSPGIWTILKIVYDNATKISDIDDAFSSLEDIKEDSFSVGKNDKWTVYLSDALDKGIELSAKENQGDFSKIFENLNKWHNDLQRKSGPLYSLFDSDKLADIIEEKSLFALQRYGKTSQDSMKVINEFRRHRFLTKQNNSVIGKVKNAIKDFKTGYDKNLAKAGFMGYFLDKARGKLPKDTNNHLNLIELLMQEPTPLRNDLLTELFSNQVLTDSDKIRISNLLYSYKEKDSLKLRLYNDALQGNEHNAAISYRDKIDHIEKYFNEPSRIRDKILADLENKYAQSINETKYSSRLKFDKCNKKEIEESTYFKDNKYLLDPKNRAQGIALTSSGSIIDVLLRYFQGDQSDQKDLSDEEKALYKTIGNLNPLDRKKIIKEMLVGLDAFEKKHLQDIKIENRTGGFSVKAWKEEFIHKIIDSFFKEGKDNGNNFMTWLIKEVFNESSVDRSASIISELIEAKTSNLKEEEAMLQFLKACGPIARKLGQILSSNSMVPEKYQKEFAKLKLSEETPIDKEEIIKIIDSELNGKINEWGAGINVDKIDKLLGSASIRTVYKVRINGKEYVAKINDPRSRSMAVEDIEIMDKLSKKLEKSPELLNKFKIQNPKLLLHNLTLSLFQDIDSRIEEINSKKLENVVAQEGNHTSKIFYAGHNVVLEEFVDGKGLHKGIKEFDLDGDKVIDKLLTSYAAQVDSGIFHADPHSENIMVTRGGDIYWIDKSMQGDFTKDNSSKLEKNAVFDILFDIGLFGHFNVFHGITAGLIMKHLDKMAKIKPDFEEKEKVKSTILEILKNRTKSSSDKFQEIHHAAEKGGYIFSDNVFMFGKSIITLSGEIKKINPNAEIGQYLRKVILRDEIKRSFSDIYNWIIGKNEETSDFLMDNRIDNLANIPWERLADESKISKGLLRASKLEFKDVKTEEDAVSALKKIFLRHGQNITIQDIEFINSILKSTKTLQILQQHIAAK